MKLSTTMKDMLRSAHMLGFVCQAHRELYPHAMTRMVDAGFIEGLHGVYSITAEGRAAARRIIAQEGA